MEYFDAKLDYHDKGLLDFYTIEKLLNDFLLDSYLAKHNRLLIVTGKGKVVRPTVLRLLKNHKSVKKFEPLESTNFYGGSFVVYI